MEIFNIEAVEDQKIIITLTLSDSQGTPADLDAYDVYAASAGIVNPYSLQPRRDAWIVEKNAEGTAYVLTSPGHDIPRGPWKYCIYIKQLSSGLEWPAVSGKISLIPRTTSTPGGISPAPYAVQAETAVTGLVHCVLDAALSAETVNAQMEALRAEAEKAAASAAEAAESLRLVTETLAINENDDYLLFNKGLTQFAYRLQYAEDCSYLMAGKLIKDCTMTLPSATNCSNMLQSCWSLQTVNLELPSATNCNAIALDCQKLVSSVLNAPLSTSFNESYNLCYLLTEWDGDMSSALSCQYMFAGCRLNLQSVRNIARSIRDLAAENNTGGITIGMTKNIKGTEELATALAAIRSKGWTVAEQYV